MRILSLLLLVILAIPAHAAHAASYAPGVSDGGFKGPTVGVEVITVKQALDSKNDTPVLLTGNITGRLAGSDDKFIFKDATGEITVDIDKDIFMGRTVSPENTVKLSGKIDKDLMKPIKVDVKVLEIIN